MSVYYIGLSVTYHDSALAIVNSDGDVLFAEASERYLQNKRALNSEPDQLFRLPELLSTFCGDAEKIVIATNWQKKRPLYENIVNRLGVLSASGLLKNGIKKLYAPLPNYQLHHMMACQRSSIERAGLNLVRIVRERLPGCTLEFRDYDHHLTHAAMACYSSPFDEASCAVVDSYGEHGAMAFYRYRDRTLEPLYEAKGLNKASLGLFYMKLTELCGFDWLKGEEWKVMGLASYGKLDPTLYDRFAGLIEIDGFDCRHVTKGFFKRLSALDSLKQDANAPIVQKADLAYTGQAFFADCMTRLLSHLHRTAPSDRLTLAGGCALNSSFNGQITQRTAFKHVHIPSAPADDGCALGAAWLALHQDIRPSVSPPRLQSPFTGSTISDESVERLIRFNKTLFVTHSPHSVCRTTAKLLVEGKLVGWIQGRAEYGPRALGNRSILADPRSAQMQDKINECVKFREMFRPFAPSVLPEYAESFFENAQASPYMDKTLRIRESERHRIAAVCHVDGTGRLQTVDKEWNPRYYELIDEFRRLTQVPVLLNTSFNVMGKPLVHSLEDALTVFMTTGLDVLVVNDYVISKTPVH